MEACGRGVRAGRGGAEGGDLADLVGGRVEAGGFEVEDGDAAGAPGVEQRGEGLAGFERGRREHVAEVEAGVAGRGAQGVEGGLADALGRMFEKTGGCSASRWG